MVNSVIVYEFTECELCGREMNPDREHYYKGLRICISCEMELSKIGRKNTRKRIKR